MNWLDVVIVAVFAWLTFSSLTTGVIREAINLLAGVIGVVLAGLFYDDLARDVELFTDDTVASRLIAFLLIFAAVAIGGHLIGVILKHSAQVLTLGPLDHGLGALFGLLKAFVLVEAFLLIAVTFPALGLDDALNGSILAPFFVERLPLLKAILPAEVDDAIEIFKSVGA
jgi:membrane protein required for colicin V production